MAFHEREHFILEAIKVEYQPTPSTQGHTLLRGSNARRINPHPQTSSLNIRLKAHLYEAESGGLLIGTPISFICVIACCLLRTLHTFQALWGKVRTQHCFARGASTVPAISYRTVKLKCNRTGVCYNSPAQAYWQG